MSEQHASAAQQIEIRSFRNVFELERRIYRVDRLRLNPSGIPVRGLVYVAALVVGCMLLSRLPVVGVPLSVLPWWMVDLALPCVAGSLAAMAGIDGRPFHLVALSAARLLAAPRGSCALSHRGLSGRWIAGSLLMLPDGSPSTTRCAVRYRGPGAVRVAGGVSLSPATRPWRSGLSAAVTTRAGGGPRGRPRIVLLERGAELRVRR